MATETTAPLTIADLACPLCERKSLDLAGAKVVDAESTRIVPVVSCGSCEFVEELATLIGGRRETAAA
jgi:hypothetical protein